MDIAQKIKDKALELGIEECGIIKPEAMLGYGDRLRERMKKIPNGEATYGGFMHLADVTGKYPWAKSIVVIAMHYGHYRLPENMRHYGKCYTVGPHYNSHSPERLKANALDVYMRELGLKVEINERLGVTGMRWAAKMAGIGIIRRNNFFYTEKGSWYHIEAWMTDCDMELIGQEKPAECPSGCESCFKACPTHALSEPYTMNMAECISLLTVSNQPSLGSDEVNSQMGCYIYGCDICQDVCPMNNGKWSYDDDFPDLDELSENLSPSMLIEMDYSEMEKLFERPFVYIEPRALWRWKINAINALVNEKRYDAIPIIQAASSDREEIVRKKVQWALEKLS